MRPMLNMTLAGSALLMLAACGSDMGSETPDAVGLPNPAAEYCVSLGGTLKPRQDAEGNVDADCHLPDGRVVEHWARYRADNGE